MSWHGDGMGGERGLYGEGFGSFIVDSEGGYWRIFLVVSFGSMPATFISDATSSI
jgi:hypothetical protein